MRGLKIYRGADATETAIKQVHGPRILHLATHGFFLPDEPPPPTPRDRAGAGRPPAAAPAETARIHCCAPGSRSPAPTSSRPATTTASSPRSRRSGLDLVGHQARRAVGVRDRRRQGHERRRRLRPAPRARDRRRREPGDDAVAGRRRRDPRSDDRLLRAARGRASRGARRCAMSSSRSQRTPKYAHPYYWASFLPAGDNTPIRESRNEVDEHAVLIVAAVWRVRCRRARWRCQRRARRPAPRRPSSTRSSWRSSATSGWRSTTCARADDLAGAAKEYKADPRARSGERRRQPRARVALPARQASTSSRSTS